MNQPDTKSLLFWWTSQIIIKVPFALMNQPYIKSLLLWGTNQTLIKVPFALMNQPDTIKVPFAFMNQPDTIKVSFALMNQPYTKSFLLWGTNQTLNKVPFALMNQPDTIKDPFALMNQPYTKCLSAVCHDNCLLMYVEISCCKGWSRHQWLFPYPSDITSHVYLLQALFLVSHQSDQSGICWCIVTNMWQHVVIFENVISYD